MTRLDVNVARCEVLFASGLQRSDAPSAAVVAEAISRTVRNSAMGGWVSLMALEFSDRPEAARDRMRWVRQLVGEISAPPTVRLAGCSGPRPPLPPRMPSQPPAMPGQRAARIWGSHVSRGCPRGQSRSTYAASS